MSAEDQPRPEGGYQPTERTTVTRHRERASHDRALVHAILDSTFWCHLGFVAPDGRPVVLPTLYARVGERLYVHGSTGSRPLRTAGEHEGGLPVCVTVSRLDGIVLARSAFHHSVNYRSVVVHGDAQPVTDLDEKLMALDAVVDQAVPGRSADTRSPNAKELAATAVLGLDLREVSAKVRTGGPKGEEPEDVALPHWSGVLPLTSGYGTPVGADDLADGVGLPAYLRALG